MYKARKYIWGKHSVINKLAIYFLLSVVGFVFLYPILIFISTSFKDLTDLVNPRVRWIPTALNLENYVRAFRSLGGMRTIWFTVGFMSLVAFVQMFSSSFIAYGFAKFNFWGNKWLYMLMLATFFIPQQLSYLPQYVLYNSYNLRGTVFPMLLPAIFGQGIKNTVFILIFHRFYKSSPASLDEAAEIDGAGFFRTYFSINLRMAAPAIVVTFIFSLVWNWNDIYMADTYLTNQMMTLPLALERFRATYASLYPNVDASNIFDLALNRGIEMAGTVITLIPLILIYLLVEGRLVESFEKTGITGE